MEFQVVVLAAGRGSRFPEIVGKQPKCLIPVGPLPLIYFPLLLLEKEGFIDAIVVVLDSERPEIQSALDKTNLNIKAELIGIPSEDFGTADSLRFIRDKLTSDVLIVPGDIITEASLKEVIKLFRMHDATISCLFLSGGCDEGIVTPGPKNHYKPERDIIGIDKKTSRLVFVASASDFKETIRIPTHLLQKHRKVSFYSKLLDTHIYVMKKCILDYLVEEKSITTIKGELIPNIVKKQLRNSEGDGDNKTLNNFRKVGNTLKCNSVYNDVCDGADKYSGDAVRCYASVLEPHCFGLRINNIVSFCAAVQKVKELWHRLVTDTLPVWISPLSEIKSTQMDDNCIVTGHCTISEKTSLRNCIINSDCAVKPRVRLVNCVLLAGAVVAENVTLEDCVVGANAVIGSGSTLKLCIVGHNHVVPEETHKQKEIFVENDRLMEI